MQNMAEASAERKAGPASRSWERNSTREAILDAARRLAARGGADAITLSGVAAEAGFAPPAVYAYFVSKDDLYLAVVADDLSKLARAMRGQEDGPASDNDDSPAEETSQDEPAAAEAGTEVPDTTEAAVVPFQPVEDVSPEPSREPAGPAEEEHAAGSETDAGGEVDEAAGDEPVAADAQEPATTEATAETETGEPAETAAEDEPDLPAEADDAAAPADEPAAPVSLVEIEQATGIVLASPEHDYAADAPVEEVPDAFPEDSVAARETPKPEAPAEPPADPPASKFRARWRRSRRGDEKKQLAVVLEETPSEDKQTATAPNDAEAKEAAIAELRQAVQRLESRPADAWLERRLRVFERTLADIETRMEKVERDSATAMSTVSEGFKALEHRFDEAVEKATAQNGESEQRDRAMLADLRSYVKDVSGRLSAVEKSVSRLLDGSAAAMTSLAPDDAEPAAETAHPGEAHDAEPQQAEAHEAEPQDAPPESHEDAPSQPKGESYLSAARRAAASAAAQAEAEGPRGALAHLKMPDRATLVHMLKCKISRRTLHMITGGLIVVVLAIVATVALRNQARATAPAAPKAEVTKSIAPSPDQRVVALAKAGNPQAELVVALKLLNGDGVGMDVPTAARWLERAAVQKQPVAEYWLATLYERGRGVDKDEAKAMGWYEQAAEAGNAKAMYRMGVAEAAGWNGEPNYAISAKWFAKAAKLGVLDAQFNLAVLYERGTGVPQSFENAFKWYAIAAAGGDAQSKKRIDVLANEMTPDDVTQAQGEAAKFEPAQPDPEANVAPGVMTVAESK